jgi:hypothetical protein
MARQAPRCAATVLLLLAIVLEPHKAMSTRLEGIKVFAQGTAHACCYLLYTLCSGPCMPAIHIILIDSFYYYGLELTFDSCCEEEIAVSVVWIV